MPRLKIGRVGTQEFKKPGRHILQKEGDLSRSSQRSSQSARTAKNVNAENENNQSRESNREGVGNANTAELVQSARNGWNISVRVNYNDMSQYLIGGAACDADYWRSRYAKSAADSITAPKKPPQKFIHKHPVRCLVLLWPSFLFTGCDGGVGVLRRISENGKETGIEGLCWGHRAGITQSCALGAQRFATASDDCTLRVWTKPISQQIYETRSGASSAIPCLEVVATLQGHSRPISQIACVYRASELISASVDGSVRVWNLTNFTCKAILKGHFGGVSQLRLASRWNQAIIAVSPDGGYRIWDRTKLSPENEINKVSDQSNSGDPCPVFADQIGNFVTRIELTLSEDFLCVGCKNGTVKIYELFTYLNMPGEPTQPLAQRHEIDMGSEVTAMATCTFEASGTSPQEVLVAGFKSGILAILNVQNGICVRKIQAHRTWIMDLQFCSSSTRSERELMSSSHAALASCGFDGSVRISSLLLTDSIDYKLHEGCAYRVAFISCPSNAYSSTIISCGSDGRIIFTSPSKSKDKLLKRVKS